MADVVAGELLADARVSAEHLGWQLRVSNALPGESLRVRIEHTSKGAPVAWASALEVLEPHAARREPPCAIHGRCGGCGLQHADDDAQLELKVRSHIADLPEALAAALTPTDRWITGPAFGYRHKATLVAGGSVRLLLGAFARGTHEVVDQPECAVLAPSLRAAADQLREAIRPHVDSGRMPRRPPGSDAKHGLRAIVLRGNRQGEVLATVVVRHRDDAAMLRGPLAALVEQEGPITGVHTSVLADDSDRIHGTGTPRVVTGAHTLTERIGDLDLRVAPLGFFQVNPFVLEALAARVAEAVGPDPCSLLDLYCGGGVLGLSAVRPGGSLLGVEIDRGAVSRARKDAASAEIEAEFLAGSPSESLADRSMDVAILDPPRAGARGPDLAALVATNPRRIVYVSCHHKSLGRDAAKLLAAGYTATSLTPADMLPQTPHVEWLATFERAGD